ncbi:hypothetical protein PF002_g10217 [Phytophthora fragariae]|uniref:Uncharacterized protein n=2 Tax=Phytophthora fragariae TaxID=53985 RepID=A0A6A3DQC8_9STRA|nr:hypothetical protein PF003_g33621 [Phytophthora fragariae]KAE8924294.1 hypothetical protein PF009_g25472 [Phytophthora fragariae]KAE9239538.1 hypothetical protein PF002_g10217 [Phytophthora fragariae]
MNNGVKAALERGVTDLIIVGDCRLAIQQSTEVIACRKETLQVELARHKQMTEQLSSVRYLHVVRHYNAAADSLATEALEDNADRVILSGERKADLKTLNRTPEILYAEVKTDSAEAKAKVTVMTRNQKRRVHFEEEMKSELDDEPRITSLPGADTEDTEFESPRVPSRIRRVEGQAQVEVDENRTPDVADIDPAVVQAERRRRISNAQDEELRWADLKAFLRGELDGLTHRRDQNASKVADNFVLSEDGLLYYQGQKRHRAELDSADLALRLVVPTTLIDEVLHSCHNAIEGGHQGIVRTFYRVRAEFYWVGLYADVAKHVQACEDCSTSKSKPQLKGYSPGNVASEFPFQMVSMDFVIPLPKTQRGNTALLLFQGHFTGYVIAKAMSDTGALDVAKAFEECVFRRFGAPSLIRHDRDPRFMSEVFQAFAELMQSRSRATLSYQPQANGQQERSVKTMVQTVRVYVEDPLQADWDDIAEKLVHAINNSRDTTRRETPFYLVHGWDAQSTLKAMTSTIKRDPVGSADAKQWRREANRQREIALQLAKEFQLAEKARRAGEHNARLSSKEQRALPDSAEPTEEGEDLPTDSAESYKSLFQTGEQVWLLMERVKPGLKKKLAHRWHGPFRVKKKIEEFAYELELPDKSGYRFYPVVHVYRLKKVTDLGQRPTVPLVDELSENQRFDFDEELLPEDSWELGEDADKYEVEAILGDEMSESTSNSRAQRLFKVKRVGYDEPTWEPLANLSCGGLLFDYLRNKKRESRLQMVQVADED